LHWRFSAFGTRERWAVYWQTRHHHLKLSLKPRGGRGKSKKSDFCYEHSKFYLAMQYLSVTYCRRMEELLANPLTLFSLKPQLGTAFLVAAGLAQSLGQAAGIINAFGLVAVFGGLIGACISALSERHVGGVKTSLVIAAVGGLAWVIAQAMFAAGGTQPNLQLQAVN
jgi:hypothetical protein